MLYLQHPFTWLILVIGTVSAALVDRHAVCTRPIVRKEWRTLTKHEQKAYLNAVVCLTKKPGITPKSVAPGAQSRYDDFVATHILQTDYIHRVGHFMPWHRYYVSVYERALRNECGYTGSQPYWDWTLDVNNFTASPVWDAEHGFGANGLYIDTPTNPFAPNARTGGGCVPNGPFKDMIIRLGPQTNLNLNARCLSRDFVPGLAPASLNLELTKKTINESSFGAFNKALEGPLSFTEMGVHGGGHFTVGGVLGQMGDAYTSPADPIFWLHHTNLDRVWWSFQKKDLAKGLTDISGPIYIGDDNNVKGGNVTLAFKIGIGYNAPEITVADTMDIRTGLMCYEYDKLY